MIYLYIKQHSVTGLKYFGKTTRKDPFSYPGSGTYWSDHINKHGKEFIQTLDVFGFDDQDLCTEFALKFSADNNIVEEKLNGKKTWANLRFENGLDGNPKGNIISLETRKKLSKSGLGRIVSDDTKLKQSLALTGRIFTEEWKNNLSLAAKGKKKKPRSEEHCRKLSECQRGKKRGVKTKEKLTGRKRYTLDGKSYSYFKPGYEPQGWILNNNF